MEELRVVPGTLLAAWPDLEDPNFRHSVVLMCHHDDDGAYGLVVNRLAPVTTKEILAEHARLGEIAFPVHVGGPVDPRALQFVHVKPDAIPGGVTLDGHLWLGGELDALAEFVAHDPEEAQKSVRLFLGYAGWTGAQLEVELASGSWLPAPLSMAAVFGAPGERTWRAVVRSIGDLGEGLLDGPPDPRRN